MPRPSLQILTQEWRQPKHRHPDPRVGTINEHPFAPCSMFAVRKERVVKSQSLPGLFWQESRCTYQIEVRIFSVLPGNRASPRELKLFDGPITRNEISWWMNSWTLGAQQLLPSSPSPSSNEQSRKEISPSAGQCKILVTRNFQEATQISPEEFNPIYREADHALTIKSNLKRKWSATGLKTLHTAQDMVLRPSCQIRGTFLENLTLSKATVT